MTHSQYRLFVWYLAQRLGLDPVSFATDACELRDECCSRCRWLYGLRLSAAQTNLVQLPRARLMELRLRLGYHLPAAGSALIRLASYAREQLGARQGITASRTAPV